MSNIRHIGPFTEWSCSGCGAVLQSRGPAPEGLRCMRCVRRDEEIRDLVADLELTLCDALDARKHRHDEDEDQALADMRSLVDGLKARVFARKGG